MQNDSLYMLEALLEAQKAFEKNEVPVGAVLVFNKEIIARAHNSVEQFNDASAHAELLCLKEGAKKLNQWRLLETTLYSTLEPCSLCAGGAILFRIKRLVYGAPDLRHGAVGTVFNVLNLPHPIHSVEVTGGVHQEESAALLQKFFKNRRESGKIISRVD